MNSYNTSNGQFSKLNQNDADRFGKLTEILVLSELCYILTIYLYYGNISLTENVY